MDIQPVGYYNAKKAKLMQQKKWNLKRVKHSHNTVKAVDVEDRNENSNYNIL